MPFSTYVENYFKTAEVHTPKKVYHYTNAIAAQSICSTGELWLFNIFDAANSGTTAGEPDKSEVRSGIDVICDEIISAFRRYDEYHFREFAEHLIADMKAQHRNVARVYTFCMSLSPNPELWSRAGRSGQAGCVEISEDLLVELCNRDVVFEGDLCSGKYVPGIVCYDQNELLNKIRPFFNRAIKALAKAVKKYKPWEEAHINCVKQHLIWELGVALLAFSQTYKESRFSHENEIRLLKIIRYPYQPIGEVNHNGRSRITEQVDRNMLLLLLEPPPCNA